MRLPFARAAAAAAVALLLPGLAPAAAQAPARSYTVEIDVEKDYFAPDIVRISAATRAGETAVGEAGISVRRRIAIEVPAEARELVFRTGKSAGREITVRLKLTANSGAIVVRPLSGAGSASGIAWMLGRRGGVTVERLVAEWK